MNIVFFGTAEFAMPALKALLGSKHKVLAVVTQPDRKKGRNLKLMPPQTKVLAAENSIPVYQPADISSKESEEYLKKLSADIFVVIAFGQILKKNILSIPKLYSINLHGSLLPNYRGAAPTNWAIINGDEITGVTVIKMNEKMDEGDILLKKEAKIDRDDTNITLTETLSEDGAKAVLEALNLIEGGKASFTKQDDSRASFAPKLKKEDGLIDWNEAAAKIHNKVRGYVPWPGAYTHLGENMLKIWKTEPVENYAESAKNGEIIDIEKGKGIIVKTGTGSLAIRYLQLEGKKVLDADAFLRGHRIGKGQIFK